MRGQWHSFDSSPQARVKGRGKMADVEREYFYRGRLGPIKLLGVLMIVMAPMAAYMASQPETGTTSLMSIPLTAGQMAFLGWAIAALLVIGGVLTIVSIGRYAKKMERICLTGDAITFPEFSQGLATARINYKRISNISVIERKGRRYLEMTVPTGKIELGAANMESQQAFDEMCAELRARTRATGSQVDLP